MSRDFEKRYPRFAIGPHDRVTIDGAAFRCVGQDGDAWHLRPADGAGLCGDIHLREAQRAELRGASGPRGRLLPSRCAPNSVEAQRASDRGSHAGADGRAWLFAMRLSKAPVSATGPGWSRRPSPRSRRISIRSVRRQSPVSATQWASCRTTGTPRRRRARGRKSMGGNLTARIAHVHASTILKWILKWVRAEAPDGKAGLADSVHRRGNRSSGLSLEQRIHLATFVNSRWMDPNCPTQAMVVRDVQEDFRAPNAKRIEDGLAPMPIPGRQVIRRRIRSINPFRANIARLGWRRGEEAPSSDWSWARNSPSLREGRDGRAEDRPDQHALPS